MILNNWVEKFDHLALVDHVVVVEVCFLNEFFSFLIVRSPLLPHLFESIVEKKNHLVSFEEAITIQVVFYKDVIHRILDLQVRHAHTLNFFN